MQSGVEDQPTASHKSSRTSRRGAAVRDVPLNSLVGEQSISLTLKLGLLGALLSYLAQPPVGWGLLAWIGPTPWLLLARLPQLPGRRPYRTLWLAGAVHWLAAIQWLRLAHPANYFSLAFVAAYLGLYLPVFIGLTRVAIHRLRMPLWLAAPIVWTGMEWVRARLLTGFLMASLAHTQVNFTPVLQIADLLGEYGVTFLIMLVAASIAGALPLPRSASNAEQDAALGPSWSPRALAPGLIALIATLGYGAYRIGAHNAASAPKTLRVALIQSDMLSDWKGSEERDRQVMQQQFELSLQAKQRSDRPIDLVVWPETMFRYRLNTIEPGYQPPPGLFEPTAGEFLSATPDYLAAFARDMEAAVLVGIDRTLWRKPPPDQPPGEDGSPPYKYDSFNSSALVDRDGRLVGTYDKMHLLPFGEYIPLADTIPLLGAITPITGSATPGELPVPLAFDGHPVAVNICYENVLPHLVRRQIKHLVDSSGVAPQLLVNVTNDAWYWGSSELDMHLASAVFRAVEMRTPMVIAANRGLSAHIDALGRVQQVTARDRADMLLCDVQLARGGDRYPTLFAATGDWFAAVCLVCCMVLAVLGIRDRRVPSQPNPA